MTWKHAEGWDDFYCSTSYTLSFLFPTCLFLYGLYVIGFFFYDFEVIIVLDGGTRISIHLDIFYKTVDNE